MKLNKQSIFIAILLITSLTFFASKLNAQIRYQKTFGGAILDWSNSVIQTPDSNFLLMCSTRNFGSGMEDLYIIKTDQHGDTLWTKTYGGSVGDEEGCNIQQTIDGGFIMSGITESFGAGSIDMFLVKIDSIGNVQWATTYGGPNIDFCTGVQQCFDGGFIVSGYTTSFGTAGGATDIYLIKTDVWGDTVWTRTYGNNAVNDYAYNVKQTADSGFIVTGSTVVSGNTDMYLIKTDTAGNIQWSKTYGGAMDDVAYSVIQTPDGYCIGGSTSSFGAGGMDAYVIKTDFNGDTLWSKTFGTSDSDAVFSIQQTGNAGLIMTGYVNRHLARYDDVLILKTDMAGQTDWYQVISAVSSARDVGRSIIETLDGGYLVSGFTQSFNGGTDVYLIKTDYLGISGCNVSNTTLTITSPNTIIGNFTPQQSQGTIINSPFITYGDVPANMTVICIPAGIQNNLVNQGAVTVSPNPFMSSVEIQLSGNDVQKDLLFVLVDMTGREIRRSKINTTDLSGDSSFKIDRGNLLPGMYMFRVIDISKGAKTQGNMICSGKLVAE